MQYIADTNKLRLNKDKITLEMALKSDGLQDIPSEALDGQQNIDLRPSADRQPGALPMVAAGTVAQPSVEPVIRLDLSATGRVSVSPHTVCRTTNRPRQSQRKLRSQLRWPNPLQTLSSHSSHPIRSSPGSARSSASSTEFLFSALDITRRTLTYRAGKC